ncbi:MAG: hypothetical protein PGN24_11870 [Microbacterium arborescens]
MKDVVGWLSVAIVVSVPIILLAVAFTSHRNQRSGRPDALSSGGLLKFDELFHPTAHAARIQWEAEQEIPIPAPTPDKGPGVILEGNKITIEIANVGRSPA